MWANAVGRRGVVERLALAEIIRPPLALAPGAQGLHVADTTMPGPCHSPELLRRDGVRDDLAVERLRIDREERRRLSAMAADLAQRGDDVLALHRLEAPRRRRRRRAGDARPADLGRQIGRLDLVALAQDD